MPVPRLRLEVRRATSENPSPLRLQSVRVVDEADAHLLAKVKTEPSYNHPFSEGDAVELLWGHLVAPLFSTMYVHRVTDLSAREHDQPSYELTLVGASWPLKTSNLRVFTEQSAASILTAIAEDHGLRPSFETQNRTFSTFVSRNSDWEALRDLARRVGGTLRVDGTTIRIFDKSKGLADMVNTPVLSAKIANFSKATYTSSRPDSRRRVVRVVNPRTMEIETLTDDTSVDSDDLSFTYSPGMAVDSVDEAAQDLRTARLSERFRESLVIPDLIGKPRLRPGEVLRVRGMSGAKDGAWTVVKADHRMKESTFTSTLHLGRSSQHPRSSSRGPVSVAAAVGASPKTTVLRQGRWVSS